VQAINEGLRLELAHVRKAITVEQSKNSQTAQSIAEV
jgi:hypothetical protein